MSLRKIHKPTAFWILILVITMTPWLSFWTSPLLSSNQQGETVIVCTVNGFQSITLEPEAPQLTLHDVSDICAAMQLADTLNASPLPSINTGAAPPSPYLLDTPYAAYAFDAPHVSLYSSRAPPVLS